MFKEDDSDSPVHKIFLKENLSFDVFLFAFLFSDL